jgi:modulator of FtsH protease HflK
MDRNVQKVGWINLAALLLIGIAAQFVAQYSGSATAQISIIYLGLGVLVAAVSCFQMRLSARERLEQMELTELRKAPGSSALFEAQEAELLPARRAREQFDRFFVPGFTILIFLLQGGLAVLLGRWLMKVGAPSVDRATITMALMAIFALLLFLVGKYSAGIARLESVRLLQPGASAMLLGSVCCLVVAGVEAATWFGFAKSDVWTARVLVGVLALVALETLINLVLEIYRPRVRGQVTRLLYESRLIGLLGQPGGLITTAAQALDYQFGFKVSETWFYQFLEKALAWIILLQVGVLLLSTSVVVIDPQEQGLLERLGNPVMGRPVLEPGLHFKWPWPIDQVYRFSSRDVHTFYIGFAHESVEPKASQERVLLWTRSHLKNELNMVVASRERINAASADNAGGDQAVPVNLITVNIPVQYRIRDLTAWAYGHADAGALLEKIANREVVRYLVNVDVDDLMTAGRLRAAEELRRRIQEKAQGLGAEIVFVGLQGIHPPITIAGAYEEVIGALQERETNILAAQAYTAERIPMAGAEATNILTSAEGKRITKVITAEAESARFLNQLLAYEASPSVYRQRSYLETLARAITPARKYVLAVSNTQDSIWLNLEDKLRPDLLDVSVPTKTK